MKVATRCPTDFLADITVNLHPRRAPEVIAAVPTPLVVAVAQELLARGEHVTIGRFVSYLSPATLQAAVAAADLLQVAFVMESKERLDELVDIAYGRLPELIRAAHEHGLWAEVLDLIGHLNPAHRAALATMATEADDDTLDSLVRAVRSLGAWDALLPITAAIDAGLWLDLLPLTRHLPPVARAWAAARAAERDDAGLEALAAQAHAAGRAALAERATACGQGDAAAALR